MTTKDLSTEEYIPYFSRYIENAEGLNLLEGLESSLHANLEFYKAIPENKFEYAYAENKWTIKELISHLIDTERIFCYRALRFSRQDKTPVAGFEQDDYVINSNANNRSIEDLLSEYKIVREASIALYKSFSRDMLLSRGKAGSGEISVRALGFLIIGHEIHHNQVIRERYL